MSTHMPGFQASFSLFASFCIGQISHQQHKGYYAVIDINVPDFGNFSLTVTIFRRFPEENC